MENCSTILNTPGKRNKLLLYWVPGSFGIEGNKSAGKLAKAGVKLEPVNGTTNSLAKFTHQDKYIGTSQDFWLQANGLVHSKVINACSTKYRTEALALDRISFRIQPGVK